jgi:transposase
MARRATASSSVLHLSAEATSELERLAADPAVPHAAARRAAALLMLATGARVGDVSREMSVSAGTVARWRRRFEIGGPRAVADWPKAGSGRLSEADLARFRALASRPPPSGLPWTSRTLARACGLTQSSVVRLLRRFRISLPESDADVASVGSLDAVAIADVIGVFIAASFAVLAVATFRSPPHGVARSTSRRRTDDVEAVLRSRLERTGAAQGVVLTALEAVARASTHTLTKAAVAAQVRRFLDSVDRVVPATLDVVLVVEGTQAHLPVRWLARRERFRVMRSGRRSDWLDTVLRTLDIELPGLGDCHIRLLSQLALQVAANDYLARPSAAPPPFVWVRRGSFCSVFLDGTDGCL